MERLKNCLETLIEPFNLLVEGANQNVANMNYTALQGALLANGEGGERSNLPKGV